MVVVKEQYLLNDLKLYTSTTATREEVLRSVANQRGGLSEIRFPDLVGTHGGRDPLPTPGFQPD